MTAVESGSRMSRASVVGGPVGVPLSAARSWLLWPATRLDALSTLHRADTPTPDALVIDLEDAVPSDQKDGCRLDVERYLAEFPAWVRVNDAATPFWRDDLAALRDLPGLLGIVLAKAESALDVTLTVAHLREDTPIVPMVESAISLQNVEEIAAEPGTVRIAFGAGDFRRDTGIADDPIALAYPRSRLVIASIAAGIARPIDGPYSTAALEDSVAHGRTMGMTGCLVLQPSNIGVVNSGFSPSPAEVAWARGILSAPVGDQDGGYLPTLARARSIVDDAAVFATS